MYETNFKETQDKIADLQRKLKLATNAQQLVLDRLLQAIPVPTEVPQWMTPDWKWCALNARRMITAALAEIEKGDV